VGGLRREPGVLGLLNEYLKVRGAKPEGQTVQLYRHPKRLNGTSRIREIFTSGSVGDGGEIPAVHPAVTPLRWVRYRAGRSSHSGCFCFGAVNYLFSAIRI
jgi:hypothetical protein